MNNKNTLKPIYFYLGLLFIWAIPFFYFQDFYRDDYTRLVTGYAGWENAGRPLATLLYHGLSLNAGWIYNLYPLPLFLSIIIFAFTLNKLHFLIKQRYINLPNFIIIPCLLLIVCNPFYIQNMAYQYDVLPMSLSFCLSILAFTLCVDSKKKFFTGTLFLFLALGLYQPAINVFISLAIINFTFTIIGKNLSFRTLIIYALQCILSVASYYLLFFILSPLKPIRSEKVSLSELPQHIINNISNLRVLLDSLHVHTILLICVIFLFAIIFLFKAYYLFKENNKKRLSSCMIVLSPILLILLFWGPLMFLKEELPFPRTYLTVGVILGVTSLVIASRYKFFIIVTYLFIFLSYYVLNSFCFVQHQQYLFENKAIEQALHRIGEDKKLYSTLMIFSYGNMPVSPNEQSLRKRIPYLNIIQKPSYRWQSRFQMAILGYDYTNSMYTYKVADNADEWNKICNTGADGIFNLEAKTQYSDIFYDKNKKYTSIWFRDEKQSVCDKKPLEFDAE